MSCMGGEAGLELDLERELAPMAVKADGVSTALGTNQRRGRVVGFYTVAMLRWSRGSEMTTWCASER